MNRRALILAAALLTVCIVMLRSLFGRSAHDSWNFRDEVLKLAQASYPSVQFEAPTQDKGVIIADGIQIGLQNLKAKFDQSDQTQATLKELVSEHLQFVLEAEPAIPDFESARPRLRPQVMPPEYAEQAPIISFPFGETLAIGIVLDSEKGYLYLKRDHAQTWKKSHEELLNISITNLDEASRKMQMQFNDNGEVKWIGVETKDGFDAARILIPKLRGFLAQRLGSPFCFAVPNRDFLICWNTGASKQFSEFALSKVRKDFETQPYPLSPHSFQIAADGTITEVTQPTTH